MSKSGPERKPHMTVRRQVLEVMRECGVEMSTARVCAHFPDMPQALIKNALSGLRGAGLIGYVGLPRQSLWRVSPDDDTPFSGARRPIVASPEAEAKFAELMGPRRFEDVPHRPEGRLIGHGVGAASLVGCAAAMCLR